jgi:hypothetical protein
MVDDENDGRASGLSWQELSSKVEAKRKADLKPLPSNLKHRLSWHEALALIDPPNADRWPAVLTLNDCIALQSQDEATQGALLESLAIDCGMGLVTCKVSPDVEYRQDLRRFTWTSRNKLIPSGVLTTIEAGRCYRVSANVFKEWLESAGRSPSPHIQNWFDAVGVSSPSNKATSPQGTPALKQYVREKRDVRSRREHHLKLWNDNGLELLPAKKHPYFRFPNGITALAERKGWGELVGDRGNRHLFAADLKAMGVGKSPKK